MPGKQDEIEFQKPYVADLLGYSDSCLLSLCIDFQTIQSLVNKGDRSGT